MTGDGRIEHERHRDSEPQPDHVADTLVEAVEGIIGS
jgi:hypothetical protein